MAKTSDPVSSVVLAIFRANGSMLQWGDRFAAPFGLTSARWQMLGALALSRQPLSAPRIAESMGVSRQGAQKQLNLLLEEGLIERLSNPANMRSPRYCLSATGLELYRQIESAWKKHARGLKRHFDSQELAVTEGVLRSLADLHSQPLEGEGQ